MSWRTCPWSRAEINRAGSVLADGLPSSTDSDFFSKLREYREAFGRMDDWRASHSFPLNTIQVTLRRRVSQETAGEVFQRLKRARSVTSKLERFPTMQLSRIQDLGGCRAILPAVKDINSIRRLYREASDRHALVQEKDYVSDPKNSGYRGRHLVYKYFSDRSPTYNGHRIEIQLRSRLQHYWATAVEVAGLYIRSSLKSGVGPYDWLEFFRLASSYIADIEEAPRLAAHKGISDLLGELRVAEGKISACASLNTFSSSHRAIETFLPTRAKFFIIEINYEEFTSVIHAFADPSSATSAYGERELEIARNDLPIDAVLVSAEDAGSLSRGYPNYFLDTDEFVALISDII